MLEREWMLGDDLCINDNLLDGITFYDLALAAHCNCRTIDDDAVRNELKEILNERLEDMKFLLEKNMDAIIKQAKWGIDQ